VGLYDALCETVEAATNMPEENHIIHDTATALRAEWGIQPSGNLSEEEILQLLAQKITEILQQGPDVFYQLMYRLDISERKLNEVTGCKDAAQQIARLIYNRQLEKIKSRYLNRQNKDNIEPDLKW
jgi:hypothetical protein